MGMLPGWCWDEPGLGYGGWWVMKLRSTGMGILSVGVAIVRLQTNVG